MTIFLFLVYFIPPLLMGAGLLYLGLRFVRSAERRSGSTAQIAALQERLLHLEESLATVSSDVASVAEAQQFTTRLLEERASPIRGGTA